MTERPDVILMNCDDLGYGDLGCYGSHRNDTPVLDRPELVGLAEHPAQRRDRAGSA